MSSQVDQKRAVCLHEAAHAAARLGVGRPTAVINISRTKDGTWQGGVPFDDDTDPVITAVVAVAGIAAETMEFGPEYALHTGSYGDPDRINGAVSQWLRLQGRDDEDQKSKHRIAFTAVAVVVAQRFVTAAWDEVLRIANAAEEAIDRDSLEPGKALAIPDVQDLANLDRLRSEMNQALRR